MSVNPLTNSYILFLFGFLPTLILTAIRKCNVPVMNRFRLAGTEFSVYQPMKICPLVVDRCCSISDEILIQQMWNGHSKGILDQTRDTILTHIMRTMSFFDHLSAMDPQLIMVKYGIVRKVPFTVQDCFSQLGNINATEIDEIEGYGVYSSQTNRTVVTPPEPFMNNWTSRNPSHAYWNLVNRGRNFNVQPPSPNYRFVTPANFHGWPEPGSNINGVTNPQQFEQMPRFRPRFDPNREKQPLPAVPFNRRRLSQRTSNARRLQDTGGPRGIPSISRDQAVQQFFGSKERLGGRGGDSRQTQILKTNCQVNARSFTKEFIIVNTAKANYCYNLYKGFLTFDIAQFRDFLPIIKSEMSIVHSMKRGTYCAVCDPTQQFVFDIAKRQIQYDKKFCGKMLKQHRDYLRFMNIVFLRYVDQILQYIQCFESDGQVFSFPFQNFLRKYIRRIPFWERCLSKVDRDGWEADCWSICNKFNVFKVSPLFDGDQALVERVSATVISFLRKWNFEANAYAPTLASRTSETWVRENVFNLIATDNVNGMMIEPVNPGSFVTRDRFTPNPEFQSLFFNITESQPLHSRFVKEKMVNDMLRVARLGNWTNLKIFLTTPSINQLVRLPSVDNLLGPGDREKSIVNGLFNQLYELKARQEITPSLRQPRYLRREIKSVLTTAGLPAEQYERGLNDYVWNGRNISFNGSWSARSRINPKTFQNFDSYGMPVTYPNRTVSRPGSSDEDLEDPLEFEIEINSPVFEKTTPHPTMDNFAYTPIERGFDPFIQSENTNFRYNISKIIGLQYNSGEKFDSPVILLFMAANAKSINNFNEIISEPIDSLSEIQIRAGNYSSYENLLWVKTITNAKKRYGLYKQLQIKDEEIMNDYLSTYKKIDKLNKREKEFKRLRTQSEVNRINTINSVEIDNHVGNGMFDELFQSVADLFIGLFGS